MICSGPNYVPRKAASALGFSLAEVLVAMFVIVVGISGVTSAIYWGLQHQDSGKVVSEASGYAKLMFEQIATRGLANNPVPPDDASGINDSNPDTRRLLTDPPFVDLARYQLGQQVMIGQSGSSIGKTSNIDSERGRFRRNITTVKLVPQNPPGDNYKTGLSLVTVRVFWFEQKLERNVTINGVVPSGNN